MSRDRDTAHPATTTPRGLALPCRCALGAAALTTFMTFAPVALSCGYEDPKSAAVQRGVLNYAYPNALHVIGALTQARMEGIVAPPSEAPASKDPFGSQFRKTERMLQQLGDVLGVHPSDDLAFSMVLIEPMLWTRFAVSDGRVATTVHINGPAAGDLVVIAIEAVVQEIIGQRLTFLRAEELGLIRIYGEPAKIASLRAIFASQAKL
jgi:hypothetical protein